MRSYLSQPFSLQYTKMICVVLATFLVLSACSSNQTDKEQTSVKKQTSESLTETLTTGSEKTKTSKDVLIELQQNPQYSKSQVRHLRLEAASLALSEQQPIEYIYKIVSLIDPSQITTIEQDIQLTQLLIHVENIDDANIILNRLQQGVLPSHYQVAIKILSAEIATYEQRYLESLRALFRINQLHTSQLTSEKIKKISELIWTNILHTPANTLSVFKYEFGDEADSWLTLANLVQNFISKPDDTKNAFNRWYEQHRAFSSFQYLPTQIQQLAQVTPYSPKNIALLLPFSGKLAKQSKAIRNGFLAAEYFDDDSRIILIDTNKYSLAEIETQITEQQVDFIVGPLLKETIVQFQNSDVLKSIPSLNLNTIATSEESVDKSQFFYALAPEDEIEQAAEYFLANNIQNPALIYADNSLGRRLAEQFANQWQETTGKNLESIAFKSKSKLGNAVKDLLDVSSSEKRIKEVKSLFGNFIKSEHRSRTDIDAVYIIANSQQTRLIKPFFDVNVSTFRNRLPIYASSRSYVVGESQVQKNDLNGLIFTEMTWLLKDNNSAATNIYNQIGDANTQLKKLFAFGFDARNLIPLLEQLAVLQEVSMEGLTGNLRVTENKRIKRNLLWSKYQQGQVIALQTLKK